MTASPPLSFDAASERVRMSRSQFYAWAKTDDFPFTIVKVGSRSRIPAAQIDYWLTFGTEPSHDELLEFVRSGAVAS